MAENKNGLDEICFTAIEINNGQAYCHKQYKYAMMYINRRIITYWASHKQQRQTFEHLITALLLR